MLKYKCRTCLVVTDKATCKKISSNCSLGKTIKEVIILLVPQMASTLFNDEFVCKRCLFVLELCEKFITQCLKVERTIEENKHILDDSQIAFVEDTSCDSENYSEHTIEIGKEDVIISIEDPAHPKYIIDTDHSYSIKTEEEEAEEESGLNQDLELVDEIQEDVDRLVTLINPTQIVNVEELEDSTFQQEAHDSRPVQIIYQPNLEQIDSTHDENTVDDNEINNDEQEAEINSEEDTESRMHPSEIKIEENDLELEEENEDEENLSFQNYYQAFATHQNDQEHECDSCGEVFPSEEIYFAHKNKENGTICEICGKGFKTNSSLRFHIGLVHNIQTAFSCGQCPKTFNNKFHRDKHVKLVHERVERQQCQECGKLFNSISAYNTHYRLIHLNLRPYICEICGKDFGRRDYLRKHIISKHTNTGNDDEHKPERRKRRTYGLRLKDPGGPVPCKICGKSVSNLHVLKAHLKTHIITKRHKCAHCELTFTLSANRNRHEKAHDLDPHNKFRCNICWKRVSTEEELEIHTSGHNNRPPQHSCDLCGEKFHRKYLLHNHYLFQHTEPEDIERAEKAIILENLSEYSETDPSVQQSSMETIQVLSLEPMEEMENVLT